MKIIINETGQTAELNIIDPASGVDYIQDFIGNMGALDDPDNFVFDDEANAYRCDQDTYDWWAKVVTDNQALERRIDELKDKYGSDAVYQALDAVNCDLENHAAYANEALDEMVERLEEEIEKAD